MKPKALETSKISGDQWKTNQGGNWAYQRPSAPVGVGMNPIRPSDCRQVVTHLPPAWRKPMGYTLQGKSALKLSKAIPALDKHALVDWFAAPALGNHAGAMTVEGTEVMFCVT